MFNILRLLADDDDDDMRDRVPQAPRRSMVDPAAWDAFWREEFASERAAFVDFFCDSGPLIDAMRVNVFRRVLCAGSGISQEPRALAEAGFDVTALDISPLAMKVARETRPSRRYIDHMLRGRRRRRGGKVRFVTGDLRDPTICRGPYDVVIDRRTLQLYSAEDRTAAMQALAGRLARRGIFFSHSHLNGPIRDGRPVEWFNAQGWPRWRTGARLTGRVAWTLSSSG